MYHHHHITTVAVLCGFARKLAVRTVLISLCPRLPTIQFSSSFSTEAAVETLGPVVQTEPP